MKKKKIINSLSKKFFIKGVTTALVVLLPFSFVKPRETKAIVGVDDAVVIGVLGTLAIGSVAVAGLGLTNSDTVQDLASSISDDISKVGNSLKSAWNGACVGMNCLGLADKLFKSYVKNLQGKDIIKEFSNYKDLGNGSYGVQIGTSEAGSSSIFTIPPMNRFYIYTGNKIGDYNAIYDSIGDFSGGTYKIVVVDKFPTSEYKKINIQNLNGSSIAWSNSINSNYNGILWTQINTDSPEKYSTTKNVVGTYPTIEGVSNSPVTINLDKAKAEAIAKDYVEKNPNDNDNDPNYKELIPFIFDMLEKPLGDGTITPSSMVDDGIVNYEYQDGSVQGQYPYSSGLDNSDSNVTVNNNINVNNGSEVTEEEKNGILNILDNGVRKTTTLLSNLKNSMSNLGNTLQGLFNFLPEPVGYLFYSALCLSLIFFILSLRR